MLSETYSVVNLVKGYSGPNCLNLRPIPGPPDADLENFMNLPEASFLNISDGTQDEILNEFNTAFGQH